MHIVAIMGVTNAGKSTLMDEVDQIPTIGKIEVGKELRRRHPPEYFKGKAAMEETEREVWDIFSEQFQNALDAKCRAVCVDGQPRMVRQVQEMYDRYGRFSVLLLDAPRDILKERARQRDEGDAGLVDLSMQRLINDYEQLLSVFGHMLVNRHMLIDVSRYITTECGWLSRALRHINWLGVMR